MMKNIFAAILGLGGILGLAGGVYWILENQASFRQGAPSQEAKRTIGLIGQKAPAFQLPLREKKQKPTQADQATARATAPATAPEKVFDLYRELQKGPIILNIWATWCPPCVKEMPDLVTLAKQLRPKGIKIVALAIDRNWQVVDEFLRNVPALQDAEEHITILLNPSGSVANQFYSTRYPETFFIRSDGTIDTKFVGDQLWLHKSYQKYYDRLASATENTPVSGAE